MDAGQARDEWDAAATSFDLEADHGLLDPVTRAAWWQVLDAMLPTAPARIADLGCGTGSVALLLAEHGHVVDGVDLSPRMVDLARAKATAAGVPSRFDVGDVSEPALEAGAYDVVFARHVVWALADPAAALRRWVGLLAPNGRLVLVEGRWGTGAGLRSDELHALVAPLMDHVEMQPLTDPVLWGKAIDDERYALLARGRRPGDAGD